MGETSGKRGGRTDEILDVAEARVRKGGFDAVSFRDIAEAVGIRSASVHYHFPQKSDLGRAMVARYAERFLEGLGAPDNPDESAGARLSRLSEAYRGALRAEGTSCLCAVLGSVSSELPPSVGAEVAAFYERLLGWTETALGSVPEADARLVIGQLQGAMTLAVALATPEILDAAAADLARRFG
ncbi:MAG: TetR/AcrR family transcriptional regulator [Pseudomonadota bacterium]